MHFRRFDLEEGADPLMKKTCIRCKEERPIREFAFNSIEKDGRHYVCEPCLKNESNKPNRYYDAYCQRANRARKALYTLGGLMIILSTGAILGFLGVVLFTLAHAVGWTLASAIIIFGVPALGFGSYFVGRWVTKKS